MVITDGTESVPLPAEFDFDKFSLQMRNAQPSCHRSLSFTKLTYRCSQESVNEALHLSVEEKSDIVNEEIEWLQLQMKDVDIVDLITPQRILVVD